MIEREERNRERIIQTRTGLAETRNKRESKNCKTANIASPESSKDKLHIY